MDKTNAAADSGGHEVKLPEHETAPPSPVIKVVKQQDKLRYAPPSQLPFPKEANMTAVEILTFLPRSISCQDIVNRLISNGGRAIVLTFIMNKYRAHVDPIDDNYVYIMMKAAMRRRNPTVADYEYWKTWIVRKHRIPANWDETSVKVFRSPQKIIDEEEVGMPFKELADGVKKMPSGDDALDLTRCVQYAVEHPDESWIYPRHYKDLVNLLDGEVTVTRQHQDTQVFDRFEKLRMARRWSEKMVKSENKAPKQVTRRAPRVYNLESVQTVVTPAPTHAPAPAPKPASTPAPKHAPTPPRQMELHVHLHLYPTLEPGSVPTTISASAPQHTIQSAIKYTLESTLGTSLESTLAGSGGVSVEPSMSPERQYDYLSLAHIHRLQEMFRPSIPATREAHAIMEDDENKKMETGMQASMPMAKSVELAPEPKENPNVGGTLDVLPKPVETIKERIKRKLQDQAKPTLTEQHNEQEKLKDTEPLKLMENKQKGNQQLKRKHSSELQVEAMSATRDERLNAGCLDENEWEQAYQDHKIYKKDGFAGLLMSMQQPSKKGKQ